MILISCPWCGARNITEFRSGGEAGVRRPTQEVSRQEWGDYLYFRDNPKGMRTERWFHRHGCRQWMNVARHTVTDEIFAVWPPHQAMPEFKVDDLSPAPEVENRPELRMVTEKDLP
ncbi:MAG: sarcosine oxidase subunit delta [Alphaproteobacteria bacterium]